MNTDTSMTEIAVELPQGTAKIEWNTQNPTFGEVKEKLIQSCRIAKNWCVEVFWDNEFVIPDDLAHMGDIEKLRIRAAPMIGSSLMEGVPRRACNVSSSHRGDKDAATADVLGPAPPLPEMFENVVGYVGRVFVCDLDCIKKGNITGVENCRGTVGLIGSSGESIGCWHTVKPRTKREQVTKTYIEYPNYRQSLMFEARVKDNLFSPELDLFIAEPVEPLPFQTSHLPRALAVSLADSVHCFRFPEMVDHQIVAGFRKLKRRAEKYADADAERRLKLPTLFSGRVCFNGWKQSVADYLCLPNCSGGVVVDDWGRLKGIHVASIRLGKALSFRDLKVEKTKDRRAVNFPKSVKKLYASVNTFCSNTTCTLNAGRNEVAAFVPVQIFEEPLKLSFLRQARGEVKPLLIKSTSESQPTKVHLLEDERHAKRVKQEECKKSSM